MATVTFTYNALRTKRAHKNTKETCKLFKLDKSNTVSIGTTGVNLNRIFLYARLVCNVMW